MNQQISQLIKTNISVQEELLESQIESIEKAVQLIVDCLKNGNKVIFLGNGGSASQAEHLAGELVGRFLKDRKPLPALALTDNSSLITALANDYSFEEIFSRQIEALAKSNDVVIGLSTSGNSANVLKAIEKAKELNIKTIGLCGPEGQLNQLADLAITVKGESSDRIQEGHILVGHIICQLVEEALFPN